MMSSIRYIYVYIYKIYICIYVYICMCMCVYLARFTVHSSEIEENSALSTEFLSRRALEKEQRESCDVLKAAVRCTAPRSF